MSRYKIKVDASPTLKRRYNKHYDEYDYDESAYNSGEEYEYEPSPPRKYQNSKPYKAQSEYQAPKRVKYTHPPQHGRMNTGPSGARVREGLRGGDTSRQGIFDGLMKNNTKEQLATKCMYYYSKWQECSKEASALLDQVRSLKGKMADEDDDVIVPASYPVGPTQPTAMGY